jgi:hypothetical protein
MRFLSTIDIFGTEFHHFRKAQIQNKTCGIFTILCLLAVVALIVILGQDFFYAKNPKLYVNVETPEGPPEYKKLSHDNFFI